MKIEIDPAGIGTLTLDEGKANAFSVAMVAALYVALDELEAKSPRALVVTGSGRHFSAGLDLAGIAALAATELDRFLYDFERVMTRVYLFGAPVIAAVNGSAVAGGCLLACACDERIAANGDYKVGINEVRLGVTLPSVVLDLLRGVLAPRALRRVVLGGELYSPSTALELGLLDEIVDPAQLLTRAHERAVSYLVSPQPGFARLKRELNGLLVDGAANERRYAASREAFAGLWRGAEATAARDAVLAGIRKPKPN
jgi:enoyl-CoA hydratase